MAEKVKAASVVFHGERIIFECPYCGCTLIRTNYGRIRRLLEDKGPPRGKICSKCERTVRLELNRKARAIIESKTGSA
ncbi:MAG: hypothetical protein P8182_17680 [Deltaproteobacteria bacterium]